MKTHTRLTTLLALVGLLAYMLTAVSCTGILSPERQAKLDQVSQKYESTTGITPTQTLGLLGKWWSDYTAARQANAASEILRTQADPATDWTSAKQVLQSIQPQASSPPPRDDELLREGDPHPEVQSPKVPASFPRIPKSRVNEKPSPQMLTGIRRQGPDRQPAPLRDDQALSTQPELPAPALFLPIVLHGHSKGVSSLLTQRTGQEVPDAVQMHAPGLPTSAIPRVEVVRADHLPAINFNIHLFN